MVAMNRLVPALVIVLAATPGLHGDDWPHPQVKEVFSQSREWFVRVTPGTSLGDTVGFKGAAKGRYARAEVYRRAADRSYRLTREFTLHNPVAPVLFLVTDRGYLVTLDNWHNAGFGTILASYSPEGRAVLSSRLRDLFSPGEIESFRHSVSSIWWRTELAYVREGQQSIYIGVDREGGGLTLEPESGRWQYCEPRGRTHLCRSSNADRVWRAFREPPLRH